MSERQRLVTSVPRGLIRFFSDEAVEAKPVNDDYIINITGSLPINFAYVLSAMSWNVVINRAPDWSDHARFRIFNGLPNGTPANEQVAVFFMRDLSSDNTIQPHQLVLDYSLGSLREWYPQPLTLTPGAAGMSFTISAVNQNDTVSAAGTQDFSIAFYQYELNQAVRFPLNNPLPTAIR